MLQLHFSLNNMHLFLAVLGTLMFLISAAVSPEYFRGQKHNLRFTLFTAATYLALLGVFLGDDFFTVFVFFEIMSFTSWVWVIHTETGDALRAAETYLFVAVIGGLTMLMGLFLLYSAVGTLQFDALREAAGRIPWGTRLAAGLCITLGFGAKAGMFPLHVWMPRSYPAAPTPATALLSSILSKSGVYGIIAVTADVFCDAGAAWGNLLLVLAVITMLIGAVLALFSTDLKRTLACSSMSQIGFILVGVAMAGVLGEEGSLASAGTTLHLLNHALIKQTLFVASGVLFLNLGSHRFEDVRGFGRGKPAFALAFIAGACTVAGIPGFSGYISKTLLHEAIVEAGSGYVWAEWLFLIAGGFTFAYMARLLYILLIAPPAKGHTAKTPYCGMPTKVVILLGAAAMLLFGLLPHATMDRFAALCAPFYGVEGLHPVHYFSLTNLKGSAISICIGIVLFLLVGMKGLTRGKGEQQRYLQVWPKWLDLENSVYRPLLSLLSLIGATFARLVEQLSALLVLGPVNLIFFRAPEKWTPPEDGALGTYEKRYRHPLVQQLFDSDLLYAGFGILAFLLFVILRLIAD